MNTNNDEGEFKEIDSPVEPVSRPVFHADPRPRAIAQNSDAMANMMELLVAMGKRLEKMEARSDNELLSPAQAHPNDSDRRLRLESLDMNFEAHDGSASVFRAPKMNFEPPTKQWPHQDWQQPFTIPTTTLQSTVS